MKYILLLILTLITIIVKAQNVNIPDVNFKAYLVGNSAININNDSEIQVTEANSFTGTINCSSLSIANLTGIEAFINLTELNCGFNLLTSIDISSNTNLSIFDCQVNSLSNLDITNNTNLTRLNYSNNSLSIDVSNLSNLTHLYCSSTSVSNLDVSNNSSLLVLYCDNNSINSIDVSNNLNLQQLDCHNTFLNTLDVSLNTNLAFLYCYNNTLSSLNVANGNNTNFVFFEAYNNPNLNCIQVDDVNYSTTNWTSQIDGIASFSTSCPTFCTINIPDANFKTYLLGNNTINTNSDSEIQCNEANSFTDTIDCSNLNISDLTGIEAFINLSYLDCSNNFISNLNLTSNIGLTHFNCYNNTLVSLNIANGNNTNINTFDARNNPDLTCIGVDDVNYSTNNWINIDSIASFSTNCLLSISTIKSEVIKAYPNPTNGHVIFKTNELVKSIIIYNLLGEKIIQFNNVNKIDISNLPKGIYYTKILVGNSTTTIKIIKN